MRRLILGGAVLLSLGVAGGVVLSRATSPSSTPTPQPTLSASPTPGPGAIYVQSISVEWRPIEAAWTQQVDTTNALSEQNAGVIKARGAAIENARRLQLLLRSLEPPPQQAALLHQQLTQLCDEIISYADANQQFADAPAFGLFGDTTNGPEKRTSAMNAARDASRRIAELIPQIQQQVQTLS